MLTNIDIRPTTPHIIWSIQVLCNFWAIAREYPMLLSNVNAILVKWVQIVPTFYAFLDTLKFRGMLITFEIDRLKAHINLISYKYNTSKLPTNS